MTDICLITRIRCLAILSFLLACILSSVSMAAVGVEYQYRRAQSSYERLLLEPKEQKYRHNWFDCIKKFKSVQTAQPNGLWADDALYMIGNLYSQLFRHSFNAKDKQEALDHFGRLLKRFPKTPYRSKALNTMAALKSKKRPVPTKKGVVKANPSAKNRALEKENGKNQKVLAEVSDLRVWSSPNYTRVVIDVDKETGFTHHLLKKDPAIGKPQRLYIDVSGARMGDRLKPVVPIGDDLLSGARAGQYSPDTVRVVLDIKSIDDFKIFSLRNPFRVVLDVNGIPKKTSSKKLFKHELETSGGTIQKGSLAKQLALGVSRIVIDPGHGGKDPGAIGYYKSILEKNVTLEVGRRLAKKIRQKLQCEAVLTRDRDVSLSLEERTAIANTKNADIFISLHANASRNKHARGIETYFLNLATDNDAILVAARENATSAKNISDLESILNDLMKNAKINESSRLAGHVQKAMVEGLKPKFKKVKDNGVKQAPFYVLLGAEMPCILVEISFISHPNECRRLNTAGYQEALADAIADGVAAYIREINPTAFQKRSEDLQAKR